MYLARRTESSTSSVVTMELVRIWDRELVRIALRHQTWTIRGNGSTATAEKALPGGGVQVISASTLHEFEAALEQADGRTREGNVSA